MLRRLLQLTLLVALSGSASAQTIACVAMEFDGHACCRAVAGVKRAKKTALKTKTGNRPAEAPSCCRAPLSSPPQQQATAGRDELRQKSGIPPVDSAPSIITDRGREPESPPRLFYPPGGTPPFLLHGALLI